MTRSAARLNLSRESILAFRRRVSALDERLPPGPSSLRQAAWAGLQDSMPRAALLSLHARVEGIEPSSWEDAALAQVWGPRFSAYVVAADDVAVFTLGRWPDDPERQRYAREAADQSEAFLDGRRLPYGEVGRGLGRHPNSLRYGTTTGRILIRWEGARQATMWTIPAPTIEPPEARLELARRFLHVFGPATAASFGDWAGIKPHRSRTIFEDLEPELTPVRTPIGDAWILARDETALAAGTRSSPATARLLPSGDTFTLLQGGDRNLLVPDAAHRAELWTPRVWPGAVLVDGEIVGTWRRAGSTVDVATWRGLTGPKRSAVEAEAASFPLPDVRGTIRVRWAG